MLVKFHFLAKTKPLVSENTGGFVAKIIACRNLAESYDNILRNIPKSIKKNMFVFIMIQ